MAVVLCHRPEWGQSPFIVVTLGRNTWTWNRLLESKVEYSIHCLRMEKVVNYLLIEYIRIILYICTYVCSNCECIYIVCTALITA